MLHSSLPFSRDFSASLDLGVGFKPALVCGQPQAQHIDLRALRRQFCTFHLASHSLSVPRVFGQIFQTATQSTQRKNDLLTPAAHMLGRSPLRGLIQLVTVGLSALKKQVQHHIQPLFILALQQLLRKFGVGIQGKDFIPGGLGLHIRAAFVFTDFFDNTKRAGT